MPVGWVAAAGLVSGVVGAAASENAAGQQVSAEQQSLAQQQSMFNTEQQNEQPYMQLGAGAAGQLNYLEGIGSPGQYSNTTGQTAASSPSGSFGSLNAPFTLDDFHNLSPQYQFNLQQGGQGTLNTDSSGQGAESGAALKDLMSFNQQYANNSYNSAFQNYQTQQNNIFNRLNSIADLGSNAGSNSATGASNFSSSIGNTTSSIGASQAAGTVGAANALTGGLSSGANAFYGQNALNQILNQGSTQPYNPGGGTIDLGGNQSGYIINGG